MSTKTETTRTNNTRNNQRGGRSPTTRPGRGTPGRGTPGRGNHNNNTPPQRQFTKYTGPSMQMRVDHIFSRSDWPKLTPNQRTTLQTLKRTAKEGTNNTSTQPPLRQVNAHINIPHTDNASVVTDLSGPGIRQVLSQSHTTTPAANTGPATISLGHGATLSFQSNSHIIQYPSVNTNFARTLVP